MRKKKALRLTKDVARPVSRCYRSYVYPPPSSWNRNVLLARDCLGNRSIGRPSPHLPASDSDYPRAVSESPLRDIQHL